MHDSHSRRPSRTGPPEPDDHARAHSDRVAARLRLAIEEGGRITFARYMQLALYEPGLGYYSAGLRKFGPQGDFTTAPELSPAFSRCLARQCAQVLRICGGGVLEFGAGSGVMARDVLSELVRLDCLPERYTIVDVSPELRERQHATLAAAVPELMGRVQWLAAPPEDFTGVVLANEVVDAFPVHRFSLAAGGVPREDYVIANGRGFGWEARPVSEEAMSRALAAIARDVDLAALREGYRSEVNLLLGGWIAAIGDMLRRGLVLIVDYGFPRSEYYHPQRCDGTLLCHYRHHAHPDPFRWPGLQDITAHVDFTAVAEAAAAAGLDVAGYTNQANFLLSAGLTDAADVGADPARQLSAAQAIKRLTLPQGMGEVFKAMALTRGIDAPLLAFTLRDYRGRL